ncbi:cobalamin B12-binding domain-containing protein [bacterium]|nr:cobalamin B12-binding domain-containing protein [bacterium]
MKVLVAKVGLDGHDRGALLVARALRDAGHEAIYSGLHRTPPEVAQMAAEESVDVVALGILSGAHMTLVPKVLSAMETEGISTPVAVGGIISDTEAKLLKELGVGAVFPPGTPMAEVVSTLESLTE